MIELSELEQYIRQIFDEKVQKLIISKPADKADKYRKITVFPVKDHYQIAKYTEKQVFHENVGSDEIAFQCAVLMNNRFM